jgi:predicted ATPase/DNA-binding CsgD family transcriptional regulator
VWDVAAEPVTRSAVRLYGLTHARTSFIGRSQAVGKVAALLDRYRLVTVTGPGGVGKTRLADEVLRQVASRFADGVSVVELATVSEPALVAATAATALEVHQAAGISIVDALAEHLSRQQLLLVLDNCEHVLDAAAELCAALLVSADDIRILATSREPLGLPEEARYRLPPLELPHPDAADTAVQTEAVTLFVERACQLNPDFAVDAGSSSVLEQLVQRLDGMPLAIELAAARVEALGLPALLDRLNDRFPLLISANRAAAARQRSLEATVDWSYQLLSAPEQDVFRRLSVFPGTFTLDAAEAVAGSSAGPAVLRLVDCSLLVPPAIAADGRARYLMLETLRGYGRNRLREAGEEHEAATALAAHALYVAEHAATQMAVRSHEPAAAAWLDAEDAAVHQGLAWALDRDPPGALRLAVALAPWWLVRGRWIQGIGLLRRAVGQTDPSTEWWYAAQLWLGRLAGSTFDNPSAIGHYTTVVDVLAERPPSPDLVDALWGRCSVLRNTGGLAEATSAAGAALELARRIGYATGEAMALTELSAISSYQDDHEQALERARQAQRIDHDQMPGWCARTIELALPWMLVESGQPEGTLNLFADVLAQARAAGDLHHQADTLFMMAVLSRQTGQLTDARSQLREAVELALFSGDRMRLIDTVDEAGYWCAATSRSAAAITLWAARDVQTEAAGLANTPSEQRARQDPLQESRQALTPAQVRAAQARGAAMTLAAAVEFAKLMTDEQAPPQPAGPQPGKLSSRERQLVTLVAQGQTDAQIAGQLFISVSTVRTHMDRIRDKTGCRRRADLTRLALQEGVI